MIPKAVFGAHGVLGAAICRRGPSYHAYYRPSFDLAYAPVFTGAIDTAFLCAGTKGYAENEGNRESFRADVDGNIRLAKHLLRQGTFVVFVSTDGVEWGAHTAYARNRLLVEMALIMQPNVAIVRPGKFDARNVGPLADLCIDVGENRKEGLHYWRADASRS